MTYTEAIGISVIIFFSLLGAACFGYVIYRGVRAISIDSTLFGEEHKHVHAS